MTATDKYLRTARLGEGVIFVAERDRYYAAIIVGQSAETVVDLYVIPPAADNLPPFYEASVEFDMMAQKVGYWANRPKT